MSGAALHTRTLGEGQPATVFAHGLAGDLDELAWLAAGVDGCRVLLSWRGHGESPALAEPWDYTLLATDLLAVCDTAGARRAVGASMGAGAILRAATEQPHRFDRLVLLTPSVVDAARTDPELVQLAELAELVERRDVAALAERLRRRLPTAVQDRPGAARMVRAQAERLCTRPPARGVPGAVPVPDRAALQRVGCPVLVLAQERDSLHPVEVAEELAGDLPAARLVVLGEGGLHFTERRRARHLVHDFLR